MLHVVPYGVNHTTQLCLKVTGWLYTVPVPKLYTKRNRRKWTTSEHNIRNPKSKVKTIRTWRCNHLIILLLSIDLTCIILNVLCKMRKYRDFTLLGKYGTCSVTQNGRDIAAPCDKLCRLLGSIQWIPGTAWECLTDEDACNEISLSKLMGLSLFNSYTMLLIQFFNTIISCNS